MSTEKEPDYAGIAERLAAKVYRFHYNETIGNIKTGHTRKGYASCMEARLRSDWETIRLLRQIRTDRRNCVKRINPDGSLNQGPTCKSPVPSERTPRDQWCWVCNAQAQLSKLLEPFTP